MAKGKSQANSAVSAESRAPDQSYPGTVDLDSFHQAFTRNKPEKLLRLASTPLDDIGQVRHAEIVSTLKNAYPKEGCTWKPASQVWEETALKSDSMKRLSMQDVSNLYLNCRWHKNLGLLSSFLAFMRWQPLSVRAGGFLWERIEWRGEKTMKKHKKDSSGEKIQFQVNVYAVNVLLDGETRQVFVDDMIAVDKRTNKPLCSFEPMPVKEDERNGAYIWPALLEKVFLWFHHHTQHGVCKQNPFFMLNEWSCVEMADCHYAPGIEGATHSFRGIQWDKIKEPKAEDHFFQSWEHFMLAKSEAQKAEDRETIAIYEQAEQEAKEKKAEYEVQLAVENEGEDQEGSPEGGLRKGDKKKSKKNKKKRGTRKKRAQFLPFNKISFDKAMAVFTETSQQALDALFSATDYLEAFTIGTSPISLRCQVVEKPPPQSPISSEVQSKEAPPVKTDEDNLKEQLHQEIIYLGHAEWRTGQYSLLPHATYAVCERDATRFRLRGFLGNERAEPDWTLLDTFWVNITDLIDAAKEERQIIRYTWQIIDQQPPVAVLHDHWKWINPSDPVQVPDAIAEKPTQGGGKPADNKGKPATKANKTPAAKDQSQANHASEEGNEDQAKEKEHRLFFQRSTDAHGMALLFKPVPGSPEPTSETFQVTIEMSCDATTSPCLTSNVLGFGHVENPLAPESNLLAVLQDNESRQLFSCDSSKGVSSTVLTLNRNSMYAVVHDAPFGGVVRVLSHCSAAQPVFASSLDAAKELCERTGTERQLEVSSFSGAYTAVSAGDWFIVGRYSIQCKAEDAKAVQFSASVKLQDAASHAFLETLLLNTRSGQLERIDSGKNVHNAQWVAPKTLSLENEDSYQVLFVISAPRSASLLPGWFAVKFATFADEQVTFHPVDSFLAQQFKGSYLPNKNRILFRDIWSSLPSSLSLRLQLSDRSAKFRLQVIRVGAEKQRQTGVVACADSILCEKTCEMLEDGRLVADLHWIPPTALDPARNDDTDPIVLQAVLDDASFANDKPYWDVIQLPQENPAGEGGTDQPSSSESNLSWKLTVMSAGQPDGLRLSRETLWEQAVAGIHAAWISQDATRLQTSLTLRERFTSGEFFSPPPEDQAVTEETEKSKGKPQKGKNREEPNREEFTPRRTAVRYEARSKVRQLADPDGQVVVRRCPLPRTIDEENMLNSIIASLKTTSQLSREDEEQKQELLEEQQVASLQVKKDTIRERFHNWFATLQESLKSDMTLSK